MERALRRVSESGNSTYRVLFRNLLSIGLMGVVYRALEDAEVVNNIVEAAFSDPAGFRVCRALAHAMAGDATYAVRTMNDRMSRNPDDDTAKIVLAVSKKLAGETDWRFTIDNVLALSTDVKSRETAMSMIDFLQKLRPVEKR